MKTKRQILVLRPDNIGDVILFSGALRSIRELYRYDVITLAVQPHIVNLVEKCPHVDKVMSSTELLLSQKWEGCGWLKNYYFRRVTKNVERIINRMFPKYDILVYPLKSPEPKHLELIFNLSIKKVIGMVGCSVNEPPTGYPTHLNPIRLFCDYLDVSAADPWQHEFLTTVAFLRFLGCEVEGAECLLPEVWTSPDDKIHAAQLIGDTSGPVIGLFPGASHAIRSWDVECYGPLAEGIKASSTFLIFGGPTDVALASRIESNLAKINPNKTVLNLAGKTTLRELFCCISRCNILISMETSGLHMGIAAGIPTIGIVGGGHYGRFVPWGDPGKNVILTNRLDCFNCNWDCKRESNECIEKINVNSVVDAANSLLAFFSKNFVDA